ncbi:MAG TPA: hypothetical protein VFS17_01330, partial [Methylophilaceae bacterium]|nr:hypothetical protein [Methylophilaceae bacterium]
TPKDEPAAKPEGKPKQEDFATYEDYLEALAKHTVAEERRKAEAEAEEAKEKQTREAKAKTYAERAEKARERMPDFDDVVDQDLPVSRAMIEVIMESDIGPDLAYYLGKNPDEATRIAQLSPIAAARELGKIEAKLTPADKTDPPKPSDAPKPPNPVKGTTTVSSSPADNDSTDSWMKKRNKQVRTG